MKGRALLLAGLFCFQSLHLRADELPPARSAAPAPLAQATPEVRQADLKALREEQAANLREQNDKLNDKLNEQARRLSRTASILDEVQAEVRADTQASKGLEASVAGLSAGIASLDKRFAAMREANAAKDIQSAAQATKLQGLSDDLGALKLAQEGGLRQLKEGLANIAALREDLKQRQSKLEGLADLLGVIKKDVDSNSEEIVEVKQALKLYEKAPEAKADGGEWWDQVLRWKYLPAVAVGLSVVAVGVAVSNR